jgi:hypothetical protein
MNIFVLAHLHMDFDILYHDKLLIFVELSSNIGEKENVHTLIFYYHLLLLTTVAMLHYCHVTLQVL